jgi:DHA1 family multidrug resistance protein-like MFS transporter
MLGPAFPDLRAHGRQVTAGATLLLACVITLVHYTGAYMRVPLLPLYARAHGASAADVGGIVAAHMGLAALTAVPFGLASDRWGRARLLFAGTLVSALTSFALASTTTLWALALVYATAGLGLSAFTPSMMSLVGDTARPGTIARAYGWYTTALYAGFGLGPILGGVAGERWGERAAFLAAGGIILAALALAAVLAPRVPPSPPSPARRSLRAATANPKVLASWIVTAAGVGAMGSVLTFFPLLARERGFGPAVTGLILGIQALVNTATRLPAGWVLDHSRLRQPYVLGGILVIAVLTATLPLAHRLEDFLLIAAVLGAAHGVTFVAVGTVLTEATTPATRGAAMGGYSTSLYVGFATAAFGLGPVMGTWGYETGYAVAGGCTAAMAVGAAALARRDPRKRSRSTSRIGDRPGEST